MPFYADVKLTDTIFFGKYKRKKVYEVIDINPGYVSGMLEGVHNFHLDKEAHNYLIERYEFISHTATTPFIIERD